MRRNFPPQKSENKVTVKEQGSFVLKGPFSDPLRKSRVWESASLKQSTQIPLEKSSLATTLGGTLV